MIILNFHGLGTPPGRQPVSEAPYWVHPEMFKAMLSAIGGRREVQVTFDDCYDSDYTVALPLLVAAGMTARFFVVAGRINRRGFLSSQQIVDLRAQGMKIGSHGMNHCRWTALSDSQLHEELVEARGRIEQITGVPIIEAACPFGAYNRRVLGHLRRAGYQRIFTSDGGCCPGNSWIQPRNTIVAADDVESVRGLVSYSPSTVHAGLRHLRLLLKRWR